MAIGRGSLGGERAGNRTPNLVVKSHLLCQLSYAPGRKLEVRGFEIKTESNPARKLNPEFIAHIERDLGPPGNALDPRLATSPNTISPLYARPTTFESKGSANASLRHERNYDGLQK